MLLLSGIPDKIRLGVEASILQETKFDIINEPRKIESIIESLNLRREDEELKESIKNLSKIVTDNFNKINKNIINNEKAIQELRKQIEQGNKKGRNNLDALYKEGGSKQE